MSAGAAANARDPNPVFERNEPFEGAAELFQAVNPFLKLGTKMQAECLQLYARRLCAYLEIPDRLSCCNSPEDLLSEQRAFFADMQQDYAAAVQRLARLQPLEPVTPASSAPSRQRRPAEGETPTPGPTQKPTEREPRRRAA